MTQPLYSPDIARSDYLLLRNLQNHLYGKIMNSVDKVRTVLKENISSRTSEFCNKRGLLIRLQKGKNIRRKYFDEYKRITWRTNRVDEQDK